MMEKIAERESRFWDRARELSELDRLVYLYGAGTAANNVMKSLVEKNISVDGMAVDRNYYNETLENAGIFCLDDLLDSTGGVINLIQAMAKYNGEIISRYKGEIGEFLRYDIFHPSHLSGDGIFMEYSWIKEHENELDEVYGFLEDDISRGIFVAFLNQRVSGEFSWLSGRKGGRQYFDKDIMPLADSEVLVDCGGYNGDSAVSFVDELDSRGINNYHKIYSFEPDLENFKQMKNRHIPKHVCIPKGVSNHSGTLSFASGNGLGSSIGSGDDMVEVDSIDNVLGGGNATIIKMDIEGYEMKALAGAEQTLRKYRPKLAVCIYNKDEDLYMIPRYIKSVIPEARFYIRIYEEYVNELVLYVIPVGK